MKTNFTKDTFSVLTDEKNNVIGVIVAKAGIGFDISNLIRSAIMKFYQANKVVLSFDGDLWDIDSESECACFTAKFYLENGEDYDYSYTITHCDIFGNDAPDFAVAGLMQWEKDNIIKVMQSFKGLKESLSNPNKTVSNSGLEYLARLSGLKADYLQNHIEEIVNYKF